MTTNTSYSFFVGWLLIIMAAFTMNTFEGTRTVLYYLLWLLVIFDIVSHYKDINMFLYNAGFLSSSITENSQNG